ncbi:MAG: C25 family cysteine peptidase [Acidobacteriota bacterium]
MSPPRPPHSLSRRPKALCPLGLLFALTLGSGAAADGRPQTSTVKITVDAPGVYGVTYETLAAAAGLDGEALPSAGLDLRHLGLPLPLWAHDGGDGDLGPGDSLRFVAPFDSVWPRSFERDSPLAVLMLRLRGGAGSPEGVDLAEEIESPAGSALPPTVEAWRRRVFEEDRVRVPVTRRPLAAELESLWFWAPISHRASSSLRIDLDGLDDRAATAHRDFEIRVQLLGWSEPVQPVDGGDHRVQLRLGGQPVAEARWDGRSPHHLHLRGVPPEALGPPGDDAETVPLELRVLPRTLPDGEPLIDLVYVDWVEIGYPVDRLERNSGSWGIDANDAASWLPDTDADVDERWVSTSGAGPVPPDPRGGWRLPPATKRAEAWIDSEATRRKPRSVTAVAVPRPVPADLDYLMIAPPQLMEGLRPLAERHRQRGLRVAVASTAAIFDSEGHGYPQPAALRRFVDRMVEGSPKLRYLLLVGDADGFRPPRGQGITGTGRGLVPTAHHLSAFGPAASDHYLAAEEGREALPRFAVGRLPVGNPQELDAVVGKTLAQLEPAPPKDPPTVLMVSDRTPHSVKRAELSRRRLADAAHLVEPPSDPGTHLDDGLDDALVAAFDRGPAIVHFNGHGSRHSWQLGASPTLGPETLFDREDVGRLEPTRRLPVVLSVSCTTAPFDHPKATSLGEAMVLAEGRGAVAFVGASSRLYTVPRFGEEIVRHLLAGESVGDAMVATKRRLAHPEISALYALLGDPALTLQPESVQPSPIQRGEGAPL